VLDLEQFKTTCGMELEAGDLERGSHLALAEINQN
jgi:hypothetical protein